MSRAPSTQLYWDDWVNDLALGRCSWAARGAWPFVLAKLHQSDEYGVLRWPLSEIARSTGVPLRYLNELATKGVLKGADRYTSDFVHTPRHAGRDLDPVVLVKADGGSCWFSARFVRDSWARNRRGAGSRFTTTRQPSRSPTRRMGERLGDGPAFASAFISDTELPSDRIQGPAEDLARALRSVGFPDCSGHVPDLITAKAAGVTAGEIADVAREAQCRGKPLAYIAKRAIGKRQDAAQSTNGSGSQMPAIDPAQAARRDEVRSIENTLIDLAQQRDRLQLIDAEQYATKAAPLERRLAELRAEGVSA